MIGAVHDINYIFLILSSQDSPCIVSWSVCGILVAENLVLRSVAYVPFRGFPAAFSAQLPHSGKL
jgi:hypothetical protein